MTPVVIKEFANPGDSPLNNIHTTGIKFEM